MRPQQPLFASDVTAAALLDMRPAEFRELVAAGALPAPVQIGALRRWDVDELRAILRGRKSVPKEAFDL